MSVRKRERKKNKGVEDSTIKSEEDTQFPAKCLSQNIHWITNRLGHSGDLAFREFMVGGREEKLRAAILYMDGLVEEQTINLVIMKSLMMETAPNMAGITSDDYAERVH
ncbi:hypothetical protein [Laceyella putida]|uniref:Uncharacterized protein n=1 Tax=Laceyella putida TaxID=110101 RepID=A0ABW2RLF3_9BACL